MSAGVEWAVHCCILLSQAADPVPVPRLAEFHGVSRTYLAKHLQLLARAGLVTSSEGRTGGYALTRSSDRITVLEVVLAIEGDEPSFRCTEIRQNGPLPASPHACRRACAVARTMYAADSAWRASLAGVTIADLVGTVESENGRQTFIPVREWIATGATPGAA
jgi:Rrf2 family protein